MVGSCASTGRNFDHRGLLRLQPGQTTLDEAVEILGGQPTSKVYQGGNTIAIWQHIQVVYVVTTDNAMMSIEFDSQNVMTRVLQLVNIEISESERKRLRVASVSFTNSSGETGPRKVRS